MFKLSLNSSLKEGFKPLFKRDLGFLFKSLLNKIRNSGRFGLKSSLKRGLKPTRNPFVSISHDLSSFALNVIKHRFVTIYMQSLLGVYCIGPLTTRFMLISLGSMLLARRRKQSIRGSMQLGSKLKLSLRDSILCECLGLG